jgi:hypothetical protein
MKELQELDRRNLKGINEALQEVRELYIKQGLNEYNSKQYFDILHNAYRWSYRFLPNDIKFNLLIKHRNLRYLRFFKNEENYDNAPLLVLFINIQRFLEY